jgi:hypothetical protein
VGTTGANFGRAEPLQAREFVLELLPCRAGLLLPSFDFCGTEVFPSRVPSFFLDARLLSPLVYCLSGLFEGNGMATKLVDQFDMQSEGSMIYWKDCWYSSDCRKFEFLR